MPDRVKYEESLGLSFGFGFGEAMDQRSRVEPRTISCGADVTHMRGAF